MKDYTIFNTAISYVNNYFNINNLLNKFRCLRYNYLKKFKNDYFKIYYKKRYFEVKFKNFSLKFYENPFYDISVPVKGYLRIGTIKENDIIVDAGASNGVFTLIAAKLTGKDGMVIAFEADNKNYHKLINNLKLNRINNIIAINKALWSEKCILKFKSNQSDYSSAYFNKNDKNDIIKVNGATLDEELKKYNIDKINWIKMDIEGSEIEAIKGCEDILKNKDLRLTIATYHIVNGKKTQEFIEKYLKKLNFQVITSFKEHLTTYAFK